MELLFISREDGRSRYYFESNMHEFDRKAASDTHILTVLGVNSKKRRESEAE